MSSSNKWACPLCTFQNPIDHLSCEMCHQPKPTEATTAKTPKINTNNSKSEQNNDEILDLSGCTDSDTNHTSPHNNNDNRDKTPLKTYPTEVSTNSSVPDLESQQSYDNEFDQPSWDEDMHAFDNDDDNNAYQYQSELSDLQKAINNSMIDQTSEDEQIRMACAESLTQHTTNTNNNSDSNHMYGDHQLLFNNYNGHTSNSNHSNTNHKHTTDIDMESIPDLAQNRKRKRKKSSSTDDESPHKKRKTDEKITKPKRKRRKKQKEIDTEIERLDDNFSENMNINDSEIDSPFASVDPETLTKKVRDRIETAHDKFLSFYLKGAYGMRTVCVEWGPKFKGRSKEFAKILSDTKWRPCTMRTLPPFLSDDNESLPAFVCRYKHYLVKTRNKSLIFGGCNSETEMEKLKGYKKDKLAEYFLPRLLDKTQWIYSSYVMIRLNWSDFKRLYTSNQFVSLINSAKQLRNVEIINIILEGVAQKISAMENKGNENTMFRNASELKLEMQRHYFRDKQLHFLYTRNQSETAEFMIRVSRSIAEHRFKKIRTNQLTISDHSLKQVKSGNPKDTAKDVFFGSLVAIHNLSANMAGAIVAKYPTTGALMRTYMRVSESEGELLLAELRPEMSAQNIGPSISRRVYIAFYKNTDGNRKMNSY